MGGPRLCDLGFYSLWKGRVCHVHWVPGTNALHLEPPTLHVGPPFSPVRRTFYYFVISFPWGSSRKFLHLEKPPLHVERHFTGLTHLSPFYYFSMFQYISVGFSLECDSALSIGLTERCFCISSRQPCMSDLVFASRAAKPTRPPHPCISQRFFASRTPNPGRLSLLHLGLPNLHVRCTLASPRALLCLVPPTLHVGYLFCISVKRILAVWGFLAFTGSGLAAG